MAATIDTYSGLLSGMLARLARPGDAILTPEFDNFILNCERRIYYGYATDDIGNPLRSDPLRIAEMEAVDLAFDLYGVAETIAEERVTETDEVRVTEEYVDTSSSSTPGTVQQPDSFLELVSAFNNSDNFPIEIVAQRVIDSYGTQTLGRAAGLIAVSGTNFRVFDAPSSSLTATLRYYKKFATPTASAGNLILTNYPDVYLYGCLIEAAIFMQHEPAAARYLSLFNASVAGLNARTQRITASANPRMRLRGTVV